MEKIDARFTALESSIEILMKTTSEQATHIAEIKKNVEGVDEIKELIRKWMVKQGVPLTEEEEGSKKATEEEPEGSKKTSEEEGDNNNGDEFPRSLTKKVELPSFEGSDLIGSIARAEKFFKVQQVCSSEQMLFIGSNSCRG